MMQAPTTSVVTFILVSSLSTVLQPTYRDVPPRAVAASVSVAAIAATPIGGSITAVVTVTNTGTVASSFGIGAEIRQGSNVFATLTSQFTSTLGVGASTQKTFTKVLSCSWAGGTYTFRAAVWTGTPGSSTWLNSYDRNFTAQPQVIAASITVGSIGTTAPGSQITASYTLTNDGTCPRSFGVGAEIRQGSSILATMSSQTTGTVQPNGDWNGSFTYTIPGGWAAGTYTFRAVAGTATPGSSTFLDSYDRTFNLIGGSISISPITSTPAGSSVTANYTATNAGNVSWTVGIGAEIRQGSNVLGTLSNQFITISGGGSYSGMHQFILPCDWSPGTYTFRAAIWSGTPGSSTWLDDYDRTFTILATPASASIIVASIPNVLQGGQITPGCTLTNSGTCPRTFGVGAEIRQGANLLQTLASQTTTTVQPGGNWNGSFQYTIPISWAPGTYTFRAAVWTSSPGSSTWLANYDRNFIVTSGLPSVTVSGNVRSILTGGTLGSINAATVEVRQAGVLVASATTNAGGAYSLALPASHSAGSYTVRAELPFVQGGHPALVNYHYPNAQQVPVPNPAGDLTFLGTGSNPAIDVHVPKPVILVHGIYGDPVSTWGEGLDLLRLDPALKSPVERAYPAFSLTYDDPASSDPNPHASQTLALSAGFLSGYVQSARAVIAQHFPYSVPIDIVAHSLGGLVTRAYLHSWAPAGQVDRVVTMGTPHIGQFYWLLGASLLPAPNPSPIAWQQMDPYYLYNVFETVCFDMKGARFILVGSAANYTLEPELMLGGGASVNDDTWVSTYSSVTYPSQELGLTVLTTHLTYDHHGELHSNTPNFTLNWLINALRTIQ